MSARATGETGYIAAIELEELPPILTPQQARAYLNCSIEGVYAQTRNYLERMAAYRERHGTYPDHDSQVALPLPNELPAVQLSEPTICTDGKRRGGRVRIFRDLLLWKVHGVKDYGRHRAAGVAS